MRPTVWCHYPYKHNVNCQCHQNMRCHKQNVQECFEFQHKKGQTNLTQNILCAHGLGNQGFNSWQGQEISFVKILVYYQCITHCYNLL